jgi:hypothetical protein
MVPGAICKIAMDTNAFGMATSVQWNQAFTLCRRAANGHLQSFKLQFLAKVLPQRFMALPTRPEIEISC